MKMQGMDDSWEDFSERLKWRFSKLTEEDLKLKEGYENDTLNRIQERLGKSRAELLGLFDRMRTVS
jgi:uncharacterized protein YjbJ (UPF0337 family)